MFKNAGFKCARCIIRYSIDKILVLTTGKKSGILATYQLIDQVVIL